MSKITLKQIAVLLGVVTTLAVNILANALPLNGLNTGEISDRFDIYFVPAGYVFSIWFVIYVGLIAYAVFQALPVQKENPRLAAIAWPFVLSCIGNIAWLFFWHYEQFALTLPAMLVILLSLIVAYLRLGIGKSQVSTGERWAVRIPFSIYLGWITVATIANATQLLFYLKWDGWGIAETTWAVIMLVAATLVGGVMSYTRRDIAYNLVLVWAFIGIAIKHADTSPVSNAAWVTAVVVLTLALLFALLKRQPAVIKASGI
jgi:translocator protein